jgi:hypothetical protein
MRSDDLFSRGEVSALSTKRTGKQPSLPLSIRLNDVENDLLDAVSKLYPAQSRNEMVRSALRYWGQAATQYRLDGNLEPILDQPLKKGN